MKEPLSNPAAKQLIAKILTGGTIAFSRHAYEEMARDKLDEADVRNTLRGGICRRAELAVGTWRYLFETLHTAAVVAFRSETYAAVVTAWRLKKK